MSIVLYSHHGCPYVQRVAIVLAEKGLSHTRRDIDLKSKPTHFLEASPLGQVPAMWVDGVKLFDSIAICEYLEERFEPRLHPGSAAERARHRGWMAFGSALLQGVGGFFKAPDPASMEARRAEVVSMLSRLEAELNRTPYFAGESFSLVDAVLAPVLRYFEALAQMEPFDFFDGRPRVSAWREHLLARPSVVQAVPVDFMPRLVDYLSTRNSALARSRQP